MIVGDEKVVVDASVALKWFIPEIHSEAAVRLLEPAIILAALDLIGPEFGSILWEKSTRVHLRVTPGGLRKKSGDHALSLDSLRNPT